MHCHLWRDRGVVLGLLAALMLWSPLTHAADDLPLVSTEQAHKADGKVWRELLAKRDYAALEKIADDLRATNSKYPNGRGKLWWLMWSALNENFHQTTKKEYAETFDRLDGWLKAHPESINARLMLSFTWQKYAFAARGGGTVGETTEHQLKVFEERSQKASEFLDQIDDRTKSVDYVYRRMRIELSKGSGEKPDVNLVYDGLKDDPTNMELVHGMSTCLLPRWFGEPGELERFADEVVRRTKKDCGELQYTTVAIATKEYVKSFTLETHPFNWKRLRQGFRDLERIYPTAREHMNHEVHFAFMADDLDAVYELMAKIGDQPVESVWKDSSIKFGKFKERITKEMLQGDQRKLMLGHVSPVMALQAMGAGEAVVSANYDFGIRMHEVATGNRRGWLEMQGILGESVSIHPLTGLLAAGFEESPGLSLYSFGEGRSGGLPVSNGKVHETAFSPAGDLVAAGDRNGVIVVVNLKTGNVKNEFKPEGKREIAGLAFSSKADKLVAALVSGDLQILELEEDKPVTTRTIAKSGLRGVTHSEKHIAVGTADGEVLVLDEKSLETVAKTKTEAFDVSTLAFSPNGEMLAFGLRTGHWETPIATPLYVWQFLDKDKSPQPLKGHKMGVNAVQFSGDGKTLISGSYDWTIRAWDVPAAK